MCIENQVSALETRICDLERKLSRLATLLQSEFSDEYNDELGKLTRQVSEYQQRQTLFYDSERQETKVLRSIAKILGVTGSITERRLINALNKKLQKGETNNVNQ